MRSLLDQPAVQVFAFWYLILVIKMLVVIVRISMTRMRTSTYVAAEDYPMVGIAAPSALPVNEDVERLRRALQNDLENILPFFGVGFIYVLGEPALWLARIFIGGFAVARILHTVFYLRGLQPHRSIAFGVAQVLLVVMLVSALWDVL